MKRDWIGELREAGLRVKDISLEARVPQSTLRDYISGKVRFGTKSKHYENIRNANRRVAAGQLRELSATPEQADKFKRTWLDPKRPIKWVEETRFVKKIHAIPSPIFYQFTLTGVFRNDKIGVERIAEGWSHPHVFPNYNRDKEEAINFVRGVLGSTNWNLIRTLEEGYITVVQRKG